MNQQLITAEYLDHMGTDLTVCNAARTSFGKESVWDYEPYDVPSKEDPTKMVPARYRRAVLKPTDANLIRFLATGYRTSEWEDFLIQVEGTVVNGTAKDLTDLLHAYKRKAQHWAPFAHPQLQIRISLPIFLARQFVKHQVGAVWSEESRRYISDEPGVWFPSEWHTRPDDVKQGSGAAHVHQQDVADAARAATASSLHAYNDLLAAGVAPEEARTILPLNMMTTVTWTGSLLFWSRVCNQRLDGHAQLAAQELAKKITAIAKPLFPVSWAALVGE